MPTLTPSITGTQVGVIDYLNYAGIVFNTGISVYNTNSQQEVCYASISNVTCAAVLNKDTILVGTSTGLFEMPFSTGDVTSLI